MRRPDARAAVTRLAAPVIVAAAVILSAPLAQQGVEALVARGLFQGAGTAAIVVPVAIVLAVALHRIRRQRLVRYLALVAALAAGAAYVRLTGATTGEAFHFVEYGLIALLFYRAFRPAGDVSMLLLPIVAVLMAGVADEWFQWFVPFRAGEARDVALDGVAAVCGLLVGVAFDPPGGDAARLRPGSARRLVISSGVAAAAFAAFFQTVHVGHEITDPDIGMFRSRFTEDELLRLARERAERWRARPPVVRRRFTREDQYLSEALWHVQRRNQQWDRDIVAAWRENLILEKYYAPVLDTPTYANPAGHRWPPRQRAEAERRAAADRRPYTSDAHPYPLYTWGG